MFKKVTVGELFKNPKGWMNPPKPKPALKGKGRTLYELGVL